MFWLASSCDGSGRGCLCAAGRSLRYGLQAVFHEHIIFVSRVYHKGYDVREPIEVRVLPDKIEILSYPGADRSISLQGLKDYRMACRRYRNRRIGEFLKELGLTEGRNTGVRKMLRALRQNGSRDPLFETDDDRLHFMVTLFARSEQAFALSRNGDAGVKHALSREERRVVVLAYFAEYPNSPIAEASQQLSIPLATLNRDIAALRSAGKLSGNSRVTWTVKNA